MKRASLISLAASIPLLLSSCDAHIGSKHIDLPWWVIVLIIASSVGISLFAANHEITKNKYKCKECGKTFYPTMRQAVFSLHAGDERVFKCPHCGRKGFCIKQ